MQKPSERIWELAKEAAREHYYQEPNAQQTREYKFHGLLRYLDEVYEAEHSPSSTGEERSKLMGKQLVKAGIEAMDAVVESVAADIYGHNRGCELVRVPKIKGAKCTCPKES